MSILTDKTEFSGTVSDYDYSHIVDSSDTTDDPAGTSYKLPYHKLKDYFGYWTSGLTGTNSLITKNSGNASNSDYAVVYGTGNTIQGTSHYSSIAGGTGNVITGSTGGIISGGLNNVVSSNYAHAEGNTTTASGAQSHAEGNTTTASGPSSHAEGSSTNAGATGAHAEGSGTNAAATGTHAEGVNTTASNYASHAEGQQTISSGANAHAEGLTTIASGSQSHAEGYETVASGLASHAGGHNGVASGDTSFVHYYDSTNNDLGTYGDFSAILGGVDHNIGTGGTNSVIIGGDGISGDTPNMVYVPDLNIVNCPAYDDDAGASGGGLTVGMVYQTTGSGAAPLNAAGILMIKQ